MGTDIHICLETYQDDLWENINLYERGVDPETGESTYQLHTLNMDRDYEAFEALAGVRGAQANPMIAEPRGVPEDVTPETRRYIESWEEDAHSMSHCTFKEILDFHNNHQTVRRAGLITQEQAAGLERGVLPDSGCQWSSRGDLVKRAWVSGYKPLRDLVKKFQAHCELAGWYDCRDFPGQYRIVFFFDN